MEPKKVNGILIENNKRNKEIVKVSIIGIIANVFLSGFKAVIGFITGSIAIVLDAVNNISDAAGTMIYVVGEELIPESQVGKHSNLGTIGFACGFILMMILDVALG